MAKKTKKIDWRTLPRKPADQVQAKKICIRVTETELEAVRARAAAAGRSLRDWIVERCM